jgi:glycosyltransferase involved in cell wall biosynthesis
MVNLANEYALRGFDIDLVLFRKEGPYLREVDTAVDIVNLDAEKTPVYAAMGAFRPLRRYLSRAKPTALLSGLTRANAVAVLANCTTRSDTRLVVTEHNHLMSTVAEGDKMRLRILPILARTTYPFADDIVAVSDGVGDNVSELTGLARESIQTIYNPIVTETLRKKAAEPCPHPWLNTTDGPPVILGAGSFTPQKDFPTLIHAFDRIHSHQDVRLVIISDGEQRDEIEALARNSGLKEVVDLPGFVDNPYSFMRAADVFALSSKWEGFGNVLVEAMACGTPVVSTDCTSGPSEILVDGRHGLLVPVGNATALAEAIMNTLNDPISKGELQNRSDDFSVKTIANQYLNVMLSDTDELRS